MLRILLICLGTYAIYHTDTQSTNIFHSTIFPLINIPYLLFLFVSFIGFLRQLSATATKTDDVNIIDLAYEVLSTLYEDVSSRYSGKFEFLGILSRPIEDIVIPIEIVLIIISFFQELQLVAQLAS